MNESSIQSGHDDFRQTDYIDPDRAGALAGVLGEDPSIVRVGGLLPPMWQLAYFLPRPAQEDLGPDGHPAQGYPSPPAPALRRMFAGGRVRLSPGLRVGSNAVAHTHVVSQLEKTGKSGRMTFLTTRTEVQVDDSVVLVEERDIVYLPARSVGDSPLPPLKDETNPPNPQLPGRTFPIDPTVLFRFSALTYNAHRIHYDREYARHVEGYPGLVVHGPLQAVLMSDEARRLLRQPVEHVEYQLVSPLFEHQGMVISATPTADGATVEVLDSSGRVTAKARVDT